MSTSSARWSWSLSSAAANSLVAVVLTKHGHSIAVTFPRPPGWSGAGPSDEELVRAMLFSAAEERWEARPGAD